MQFEQLKLSNQVCFPIYAVSRLITREYQPHLEKMGITYPQYLVLLVLWETDGLTVNEISRKLILNTNTVTPLLKRMETLGIISRKRSGEDERKVVIHLTGKGKKMESDAAKIPEMLGSRIVGEKVPVSDLLELRDKLTGLLNHLSEKEPSGMPE